MHRSLMLCAKAFLAAFLAVAAAYGQTPPVEAKQLLSYIDQKGAGATLKELTAGFDRGDERQWNAILAKVNTGAPLWLEVARKLLPVSDGAVGEGLYISLAVALTHNPEGVLSMAPASLTLEQACSVPFIEADDKTERQHILKVRVALRRVVSPALASKKTECLKIINADAARAGAKP